jgi:hypothetical protein
MDDLRTRLAAVLGDAYRVRDEVVVKERLRK